MKNKYLISVGLLLCSFILINCKENSKNNNNNSNTETNNINNFNTLVQEWNKAHSSKDVGVFSNIFDNTVLFYGTQMDKNSCIQSKLSLFKKYPDFYQQIDGDIQIDNISDTEVKCNFIKRVTVNHSTKDYPSYLTFKKSGDDWKIITEGDLLTDKNLAKTKDISIPKNAVKGDYNGDGILDHAWLVLPKKSECDEDCGGNCTSYIKFSDTSIPSIKIEMSIGGNPDNLGDLNKDGSDEIGILPEWCTSCWRAYNVYTLKNGKWIFAVEPFSTHCNQWEEGIKPIEIDYNKTGNVLVRYSEHTGEDIITKTKSVPIK